MRHISNVDNSTYMITVSHNGGEGLTYMNRDGVEQHGVVRCNKGEAETVMNCVASGYWGDIKSGIIISWRAESALDKFVIDRVIEISTTVDDPIEYTLTHEHESEQMFLLAVDHDNGEQVYVADMLRENPFVDDFVEGKIYYFDSLKGLDGVIQRNFINSVVTQFSEMFHRKYDIVPVWCKIKE